MNVSFSVQKKLILVGEPKEIFKNSALVKNMFTSDLEVTKFLKARIQTVSGIRGVIKKPNGNEGMFRASFEDKIIMSDILFLKTWVNVEVPRFYISADSQQTALLRSIYEIKQDLDIKSEFKPDSIYNKVERPEERHFSAMKIPKKVFENQSYLDMDQKRKDRMLKEDSKIPQSIPALKSDKEKEIED